MNIVDGNSGANVLRLVVRNMDYGNEEFNQRYTVEQLVKIYVAHLKCRCDFLPHQWEERQVREALQGIVPQWDTDDRPIYPERPPTRRTVRAFLRSVYDRKPVRWSAKTIQHCLDTGLVQKASPGPYRLTRDGLIEAGVYEG